MPFDLRDDYDGLDGGLETLNFGIAGFLEPPPGSPIWEKAASNIFGRS